MKLRNSRGMVLCGLAVSAVLALSACSGNSGPVISNDPEQSAEDTGTLTALARGKVRRDVLDTVRAGFDGWMASDGAAMRDYFTADIVDRFEKTWAGYAAEGLRIKHVHDVEYQDLVELDKSGTQASVTYIYKDKSYLINQAGDLARKLPVLDKEIQLTLVKDEKGNWQIVRMFGPAEMFR